MSKFGALIDQDIPVLIDFFSEGDQASVATNSVLRVVSAALGDQVKVIKIDVDKNPDLAEALRVKGLPTLVVYKKGEMRWRQSGAQSVTSLTSVIQKFI